MKRVVVTGATSMIGTALIRCCIDNGIEVLAIVRKDSKKMKRLPESELIKIQECDLNEFDTFAVDGKKYDVFYHFAWGYTSKATRDNPLLQEKNIQYTLDAVELARRLGCYKFIGAGSQAEYGIVHQVITAETKENPCLSYGIAKNAAGRLSRKLCEKYGITHIWGRIFSVYGSNDSEETMISYAIRKFLRHETAYFSAATQQWDYLYEEDAGEIFYLLGEKVDQNNTYRVASGQSRPLKEFILEMKNLFGDEAVCEFGAVGDGNNLVSLQVDVGDLKKDIDFVPQVLFREGVNRVVGYWKIKEEDKK